MHYSRKLVFPTDVAFKYSLHVNETELRCIETMSYAY